MVIAVYPLSGKRSRVWAWTGENPHREREGDGSPASAPGACPRRAGGARCRASQAGTGAGRARMACQGGHRGTKEGGDRGHAGACQTTTDDAQGALPGRAGSAGATGVRACLEVGSVILRVCVCVCVREKLKLECSLRWVRWWCVYARETQRNSPQTWLHLEVGSVILHAYERGRTQTQTQAHLEVGSVIVYVCGNHLELKWTAA